MDAFKKARRLCRGFLSLPEPKVANFLIVWRFEIEDIEARLCN